MVDGTFLEADVIGRDPYMDTVILRAQPGTYAALELGSSDLLRPGEQLIADGDEGLPSVNRGTFEHDGPG